MALTQTATDGIKDDAVTLDKLEHGTSSNNGKFLRANNGAAPSFESLPTSGIGNLVEDTSPELGGNLETNSNNIKIEGDDKIDFDSYAEIKRKTAATTANGGFVQQNSLILDGASDDIWLTNSGQKVVFGSSDSTAHEVMRVQNAAVGASQHGFVNLNYVTANAGGNASSATKLATTATGVTVTGTVTATSFSGDGSNLTGVSSVGGATGVDFNDGVKIRSGTGNDLEIYHDGTNTDSYVTHENASGHLYLQGDAIKLRTSSGTSNEVYVNCSHNASVDLYYNNEKKFHTTSTGAAVTNTDSPLTNANSGANDLVVSGDGASGITIHSTSASDNQNTSIYFSDSSSTTIGAILYKHSNDQMRFQVDGGLGIQLNSNKTVYFQNSIYASSFETSSDLTHKSNLVPFTNTLDKLKGVNGYTFDMKVGEFKDMTTSSAGIIAQDVEKVFPKLVSGEEGEKTVQYNGLIGVLIEAVKELTTKIETLETKVAALEAA